MSRSSPSRWSRLEPVLIAFFIAAWFVDLLAVLGVVELRGSLDLGLYPLYSTAVSLGWLAGHLYVGRSRHLPAELRRKVWVVYFLGPPGLLYLLRAMASVEAHRVAPLVPLYAFGVFSIFFAVPVLMPVHRRDRSPGADERDDRRQDG